MEESPEGRRLVEDLTERHGALLERREAWTADKGYDITKLFRRLWDEHGIRPVVSIRDAAARWGEVALRSVGHTRPQGLARA